MTITEKFEAIAETIENLDTETAVSAWNAYAEANNMPDDMIYSMDDFSELVTGEAWNVACMVAYGHFNPQDDYFWFNGYGNLCSSDFPDMDSNSPYCGRDMTDYIQDNWDALGIDEIEEIMSADEDDEDEE